MLEDQAGHSEAENGEGKESYGEQGDWSWKAILRGEGSVYFTNRQLRWKELEIGEGNIWVCVNAL